MLARKAGFGFVRALNDWRVAPRSSDWRAKRPVLLAYLAPAALVSLLVQTWFRSGTFIAGGDLAPFIRTSMAAELGSMWGTTIVGAGSPTYRPTAAVPELIVLGATRLFGLSNQTGQRLFYTAVVIALVVSTTFFVRAFVSRPWIGAVSGLLAFFNPFVLQTVPAIVALVATAMMAAVGGLVLRAAKGQPASPFALAAVLAISGYVVLSPPLLAMAVVWTIAMAALGTAFFGTGGTRRAFGLLVRTAPWALLLNLWWMVPYVTTLLTTSTTETLDPRNVFELNKRSYERLNLANVVSLAGHRGWRHPHLVPYAASLERLPWGLLKFAIPLLAFLAVFTVRRERMRPVVVLIGLSLPLLFLGKGLHEPLTSVNAFLYGHVPGMWLLRNPLSKVAPAILLAYLALAGIALESAVERWRGRASNSRLILGSMMVLVGAAVAYPTPLWTGEVIRDDEPPAVYSRYIGIPDAWFSVADFVNALPETGKVLVLPLGGNYQVPTTWGYYGIDVIPRYLLEQATIQARWLAVFSEQANVAALLRTVESSLATGETKQAVPGLHALGAKYVIVRRDMPLRAPAPLRRQTIQDYRPIEKSLRESPQVKLLLESNIATVFQLDGANAGFIGTASVDHSASRGSPDPIDAIPPRPRVQWRRDGPSSYVVQVPPTQTGLVLELRETFDGGWRLQGLPDGRRAEHGVAHEYANAWRISPGAGFTAQISYAPDRLYHAAIAISLMTSLSVYLVVFIRRRRVARRVTMGSVDGAPDGENG